MITCLSSLMSWKQTDHWFDFLGRGTIDFWNFKQISTLFNFKKHQTLLNRGNAVVKQQAKSLFSEADTLVSEGDSKQMFTHIDKRMMSMQTTSLSSCPPSSASPAPVTWNPSAPHLSQGLCSTSSWPEILPPTSQDLCTVGSLSSFRSQLEC